MKIVDFVAGFDGVPLRDQVERFNRNSKYRCRVVDLPEGNSIGSQAVVWYQSDVNEAFLPDGDVVSALLAHVAGG